MITDATPPLTEEMFEIYQENYEAVRCKPNFPPQGTKSMTDTGLLA